MHGVPPGGPVIGEAVGTRVPGLHSSSAALGWGDRVSPRATARELPVVLFAPLQEQARPAGGAAAWRQLTAAHGGGLQSAEAVGR